jgi:hypothetical protein
MAVRLRTLAVPGRAGSFSSIGLLALPLALTIWPARARALQSQGSPQTPGGEAGAAPQPEAPATPKRVRLALPRSLMPPDYPTADNSAGRSTASQGTSLPPPATTATAATAQTAPQVPQRGPASLDVEYSSGRLSVASRQTPLSEVLRQISQKTGLEIDGASEASQIAAIQFSNLPLSEAVQDLLDGTNYILVGKLSSPEEERRARIVILGTASEGSGQNGTSQ